MRLKRPAMAGLTTFMIGCGANANADAVSERLRTEMRECVLNVAPRLGNPLRDGESWAEVISRSTTVSYSMIKLFGTAPHGDIASAMTARTRETIFSSLEDAGITNFRAITMETIDACMISALVAASDELERLENAACPDQTDYLDRVGLIEATDSELKQKYGSGYANIREMSDMMLQLSLLTAFPSIFRYGQDEYPNLNGDEPFQDLDAALLQIDVDTMQRAPNAIVAGLDAISRMSAPLSERVAGLQTDLHCLQDWVDVYPWEEMNKVR